MNNQKNNHTRELLSSIHDVLNEPVTTEQTKNRRNSTRNSPADNTLRELLLSVHEDTRLAEFVKDRRYASAVYDPNPDDETTWMLDYWKEKDGKVQFVYRQPVWGMGHGGDLYDFELDNGRFYVGEQELLELFPSLTVQNLEEEIKTAIRKDKEYKSKKNPPR